MLEIGSIIDGKYKILNKIGQGGMRGHTVTQLL